MSTMEYKVGLVIEHLKLPRYGRGKIISVRELSIEILFSTGQVKKYSTENLMVRISEDQSDPCPVVRPALKSRSSVKKSNMRRQRDLPIFQQRNGGEASKMSKEIIGNLQWEKWLLIILVELLERRSEVYPTFSYQELRSEKTFANFVKSAFGKRWCQEFKSKPDSIQRQLLKDTEPKMNYDTVRNGFLLLGKSLMKEKKRRDDALVGLSPSKTKRQHRRMEIRGSGGTRGYFSRNYSRHR